MQHCILIGWYNPQQPVNYNQQKGQFMQIWYIFNIILQMCTIFIEMSFSYLFPRWQILDSSKLKEFADDNFEFDENGENFSKRVEKTVGKAEIACNVENPMGKGEIDYYKQFLLFPQCFQKSSTADT